MTYYCPSYAYCSRDGRPYLMLSYAMLQVLLRKCYKNVLDDEGGGLLSHEEGFLCMHQLGTASSYHDLLSTT